MANFSQCCPYFIGMNNAVVEEAKAYANVTIISTDANGDAAKFQSDIEDLIAQGIDGIIISGAWLEEAPAALDALAAEGIPTVLVDRQFGAGQQERLHVLHRPGQLHHRSPGRHSTSVIVWAGKA